MPVAIASEHYLGEIDGARGLSLRPLQTKLSASNIRACARALACSRGAQTWRKLRGIGIENVQLFGERGCWLHNNSKFGPGVGVTIVCESRLRASSPLAHARRTLSCFASFHAAVDLGLLLHAQRTVGVVTLTKQNSSQSVKHPAASRVMSQLDEATLQMNESLFAAPSFCLL